MSATTRQRKTPDISDQHVLEFKEHRERLLSDIPGLCEEINSINSIPAYPVSESLTEKINSDAADDDGDGVAEESPIVCAICLSDVAAYGVVTSCGHVYCCACLMTYWRHQTQLGRMKCPTCRTAVTQLRQVTATEAVDQNIPEDHDSFVSELESYNLRFSSEPKPMFQHVKNILCLVAFWFCEFLSVRGLVWMIWVRMFIVICTLCVGFLSILDVTSDIAGYLADFMDLVDRVFLCTLMLIYSSIILRRNLEQDGGNGIELAY